MDVFLVQSLYFAVLGGSRIGSDTPAPDPFDKARQEAEQLMI